MVERLDQINYYLDIAQSVSKRGTCLRRNYGCIIVKNDEIISTGYSGSPRGRKNCIDIGTCFRQTMNIPRGQMYEKCRSVHSEMNAIISAARRDMIGSTLFLVGFDMEKNELVKNADSCSLCKRLIINAGIDKVVIRDSEISYRIIKAQDWVENDDSLLEALGY